MMMCQKKITHTIEAGDTLYNLSKKYDTTVTDLILGNPGANTYNLRIGMQLRVCPGEKYLESVSRGMNNNGTVQRVPNVEQTMGQGILAEPMKPQNTVQEAQACRETDEMRQVLDHMRFSWLSQIYWIRMYLMSVMVQAKDMQDVEERMLETADELTDAYQDYLPIHIIKQLHDLFLNQTELIGEGVRLICDGKKCNYQAWQENADLLTELFVQQNPYYGNDTVHNMLFNYLDMTHEEIEEQKDGKYGKSITTFAGLEEQVMKMADFLAQGLFQE